MTNDTRGSFALHHLAADARLRRASSVASDGNPRAFRRVDPPGIFSALGACHAVWIDAVSHGPVTRTDTADVELCELPLPASLANAVPARRRSNLTGRHCAAHALDLSGSADANLPLTSSAWGAPNWPEGFRGIDHAFVRSGGSRRGAKVHVYGYRHRL